MKNFEAKNLYEKLNKIDNEGTMLPSVVNFARYRTVKVLAPIVESYTKALDDILIKYGTPTEENGKFKIEQDKIQDYVSETNELSNMEIDVSISTFPISKLESLPDLKPYVFDALAELAVECDLHETPNPILDKTI